jgi:hypothetical protein
MKERLPARLKPRCLSRAILWMDKMSEDRTYNGWTNYETWAVALWLDNEQGSYLYWREQAEEHWKNAPECGQVAKGIWSREEAAKFNLADQLRDEIRENSPIQEPCMYSDLLSGALDEVNWKEIAGNWLEDWIEAAEKEEKEAETEQDQEENDKAEEEKEPEEWPVISSYTRAQALADGVLVDVSKLAGEVGIIYPTAMTAAVWANYVKVPKKATGQDETGRLWDILNMLRIAIKGSSKTDQVHFSVIVKNGRSTKPIQLKSICGPGDSAEPVVTIMLPEED